MRRTRRFVLLVIVASLLAVLLVPFLWYAGKQIYFRATQGKIVTIDGVRQNNRVYIKDAYYDGDERKICYTTVNNKNKLHVYRTDCIWIEKKVGDQWEFCVDEDKFKLLLAEKMNETNGLDVARDRIIPPSSEWTIRRDVDKYWNEVTPGEYRIIEDGVIHMDFDLIEGRYEVLGYSVSYPENGYCIVGYFTITEDMLVPAS